MQHFSFHMLHCDTFAIHGTIFTVSVLIIVKNFCSGFTPTLIGIINAIINFQVHRTYEGFVRIIMLS